MLKLEAAISIKSRRSYRLFCLRKFVFLLSPSRLIDLHIRQLQTAISTLKTHHSKSPSHIILWYITTVNGMASLHSQTSWLTNGIFLNKKQKMKERDNYRKGSRRRKMTKSDTQNEAEKMKMEERSTHGFDAI